MASKGLLFKQCFSWFITNNNLKPLNGQNYFTLSALETLYFAHIPLKIQVHTEVWLHDGFVFTLHYYFKLFSLRMKIVWKHILRTITCETQSMYQK